MLSRLWQQLRWKAKIVSSISAVVGVLALLCVIAAPASANVITVTNIKDSGPDSLRQALADANDVAAG